MRRVHGIRVTNPQSLSVQGQLQGIWPPLFLDAKVLEIGISPGPLTTCWHWPNHQKNLACSVQSPCLFRTGGSCFCLNRAKTERHMWGKTPIFFGVREQSTNENSRKINENTEIWFSVCPRSKFQVAPKTKRSGCCGLRHQKNEFSFVLVKALTPSNQLLLLRISVLGWQEEKRKETSTVHLFIQRHTPAAALSLPPFPPHGKYCVTRPLFPPNSWLIF